MFNNPGSTDLITTPAGTGSQNGHLAPGLSAHAAAHVAPGPAELVTHGQSSSAVGSASLSPSRPDHVAPRQPGPIGDSSTEEESRLPQIWISKSASMELDLI